MPDIATLGLAVDATGAVRNLRDFDNNLERTGHKAAAVTRNIKSAFATLGVSLGTFTIFQKFIRETEIAQREQAQLGAVLRSTGGVAGRTAEYLNNMAQQLQRVSVYSDDAITSAQALLLTFTRIRGNEFDAATRAILDMSTAMGTDLRSSALQVGKALNDPIEGVGALSRVGVSFSERQKDVIKQLVETGKAAEAQRLILKELQVEFGGSAEAARNTLGGSLRYLGNQWDNLFERTDESTRGMVSAINRLADSLPSAASKFDSFFRKLAEGFTGLKIGYLQDAADIQRILLIANQVASKIPGVPGGLREQMRSEMAAQRKFIEDTEKQIKDARSRLENSFSDVTSGSSSTSPRKPGAPDQVITDTSGFKKYREEVEKNAKFAREQEERAAERIKEVYIAVYSEIAKRRAELNETLGLGSVGTNAVQDIERRGGFDNLVDKKILDRFTNSLSRLERAAQLAGQALEYWLVSRIGGGSFGSSFGAAVAKGGLQDAAKPGTFASTAVGGAVLGPIAGAIGAALGSGLNAFAKDIFNLGGAAKEAAAALKRAREDYARSLASERAGIAGDSLTESIIQVQSRYAKLREEALKLNTVGTVGTESTKKALEAQRAAALEELNRLEAERIRILREEDVERRRFAKEDLEVRALRATGRDREADRLAQLNRQQQELFDAQAQNMGREYIERLKQIHALELANRELNKLTTAAKNAPRGFKVESYINHAAAARPSWEAPAPMIPFSPTNPGMPPKTTINVFKIGEKAFFIDGDQTPKEIAKKTVQGLREMAATTVGLNVNLSEVLDYVS